MAANGSGWTWSGVKERAAALVADDDLTDDEIVAQLGIAERTFYRWKARPEFQERVDELIDALEATAKRRAIARLSKRLDAYQDRWERMRRLIEARAADQQLRLLPGGDTGLVVGRLKSVKLQYAESEMDEAEADGEAPPKAFLSTETWEAEFDAALLRELRELEKQAAQDAGQWSEKREITGSVSFADLWRIADAEPGAGDPGAGG